MNSYLMNSTTESIEAAQTESPVAARPIVRTQPCNIQIVRPQSLSGAILEDWNRIRRSNTVFNSPYFDVEFTKAVGRVRDDVRIAIAETDGNIVGILPFQENTPGHAVPVGGLLNDWHGIMGKQDPQTLELMLKAAKLDSFKFHAIDASNDSLAKYYFREFKSHYADLSDGWEAYRRWARKNSSTIKRQGQKTRGLGREVGEVRFEFESEDPLLLERLIELKRTRYTNSNTFDILGVRWASDLLREIHRVRQPNFRGILSVLWAGDELVGAHFGMLTNDILHYWFPVYDPRFHKYSPGTEMLMQSAEHACELGARKLDLGYGDDAYKFKFCNASEPVAFGMANFNPLSRAIARRQYTFRNHLKQIPMKPLVKRILRRLYPRFGGWNFR
ncbi:GNAT family N-acetyltransferase [Mariniblastus fucicola]|nr:GNAT family N-acetyltransferase [Mariniblastus fucicola]